jgi:hypothetical protein
MVFQATFTLGALFPQDPFLARLNLLVEIVQRDSSTPRLQERPYLVFRVPPTAA